MSLASTTARLPSTLAQPQFNFDPYSVPDDPEPSERCEHSCCCGIYPTLPRSQSLAMDNIPLSSFPSKTPKNPAIEGQNPVAAGGSSGGPGTTVPETSFSPTQTLVGRPGPKKAQTRRHPLIPSKTIVVPPTSSPFSELFTSKDRAATVACMQDAKLMYRDKLLRSLPNKLTTTGVRIFYLCDKGMEKAAGYLS